MFVAWGVLVPAAVLSARYLKALENNGLWFKLHKAFNALALLLMAIGLGIVVSSSVLSTIRPVPPRGAHYPMR